MKRTATVQQIAAILANELIQTRDKSYETNFYIKKMSRIVKH